MRSTVAALLVALAGPHTASAADSPALRNPDFERGEPGRPADGWSLREVSARQGYTVRLSDRGPVKGRMCLEVSRKEALKYLDYSDRLKRLKVRCYRYSRSHIRCPVLLKFDSPFPGRQCYEGDTFYGMWHNYSWVQVFNTHRNFTFSTYKSRFRTDSGIIRCPGQ